MAKGKKGALYQLFVPMVDATDFGSIESAITESDFNSGVTKKFYGMNHGGSAATTSGTISKPGSLVRSGVFRITLKGTENNYDTMMARFNKTGCAERIFIWENLDNDDSDLMSYLVALSAAVSDAHSAAILGASNASEAQSQATLAASRTLLLVSSVSDMQSYLAGMSGMLSDTYSAAYHAASHASDALSSVRLVQSRLSDLDSRLASDVSDIQSAIARHDANMVMRRNAVVTAAAATITLDAGAAAVNSLYNDMTIAVIAGTGAGQVRAIQNYVGATKIATISPNWENVPTLGDSYVLLTNRTDHSHLEDVYSLVSQLNSYVVVMSGMLSDTHSAAILAASTASEAQSHATLAASRALVIQSRLSDFDSRMVSDISDVRSAIAAITASVSASDISDIASAVWANTIGARVDSRVLLIQSRLSDFDSRMVSDISDVKSAIAAITITLSASDISDIASAVAAAVTTVTPSDISDIASAVWANAIGARVDSRVLLVQSRLSDFDSRLVSDISDMRSQLTVIQSMASDAHSAAVLAASAASDAYSAAVVIQSRLSDFDSRLVSDISDVKSAVAAAIFTLTASDISDIASAVWAHSVGAQVDSRLLLVQSRLSDFDSRLVSDISDVRSQLTVIQSLVSDVQSAVAAGVPLNASALSDLRSAITANGLQAAGLDVTGVVAATGTYGAKLDWLAALARNKVTQDASVQTLYDDAGSAVASAAVSDDSTTFTREEWA